MKQLLVEIDDRTAAELERVAPARSRKRSEFVRHALRRALWEQKEHETRAAYLHTPDDANAYLEPKAWEPPPRRARSKR